MPHGAVRFNLPANTIAIDDPCVSLYRIGRFIFGRQDEMWDGQLLSIGYIDKPIDG